MCVGGTGTYGSRCVLGRGHGNMDSVQIKYLKSRSHAFAASVPVPFPSPLSSCATRQLPPATSQCQQQIPTSSRRAAYLAMAATLSNHGTGNIKRRAVTIFAAIATLWKLSSLTSSTPTRLKLQCNSWCQLLTSLKDFAQNATVHSSNGRTTLRSVRSASSQELFTLTKSRQRPGPGADFVPWSCRRGSSGIPCSTQFARSRCGFASLVSTQNRRWQYVFLNGLRVELHRACPSN